MKAIQIYKFIADNKIEWHWDNNKEEVYLMTNFHEAEMFNKLLGEFIFDEEPIEVFMKYSYICYPMSVILDRFDIELKDIFTENENEF